MGSLLGAAFGFIAWFFVRYGLFGFFTVGQNERAVITSFGRAQRVRGSGGKDLMVHDVPELAAHLDEKQRERYSFPLLRVVKPGGPYFKFPWQRVHKVSIATNTVSIAFDPEQPQANESGRVLEAVTKDQLNTGLTGQLRHTVAEENLYAYLFGVKNPIAHVMGFFVSVLRERIANFEAPHDAANETPIEELTEGISINDLRKNLRSINDHMERECAAAPARYGIRLDAALITGIDPPDEVDSALAAINTAHNHVSSDISVARAAADQKLVQSKRAVEIETLNAQAEVEPLRALAAQLADLKRAGPDVLAVFLRNQRLALLGKARRAIVEVKS